MKRREARELAFTLFFESTYNHSDSAGELYDSEKELRGFEDDEYVKRVIGALYEHRDEIDELISSHANKWKIDRLSRTTISILRLSLCEMLYLDDIPFNISINEALELSKQYDVESAPAFINGILNSVAQDSGLKENE